MAGITDLPFRARVAAFGAGLVVSEMVASQEMVQAKPGIRARADLGGGRAGSPSAVQIAGRAPYWMAEAARLAEANGAALVDINMGCPAKKVTGGQAAGAALMREPDLALRLVEAVRGAVACPVTVKMRLGWEAGQPTAAALARRLVEAGAAMVTVHGRSRCQFYKGRADWRAIRPAVGAVAVPVVVNGDIVCGDTARDALRQSGAAGIMIGRGAQGRPWAPAAIAAALGHRDAPEIPQGAALADYVAAHHQDMLAFYGAELGLRVARKHLGWYMDGAGTPPALRREVLTASTAAEVARLLPLALAVHADAAIAA